MWPRILLTAIGSLSAPTVIAALRGIPGVYLVGCDMHPGVWLEAAAQVDVFVQTHHSDNADAYLHTVHDICLQHAITHVVALTDPEIDLLSEHGIPNVCLCASPVEAIRVLRDKRQWARVLAEHTDIPIIPTVALNDSVPSSWRFPLAAKPRRGRSRVGFYRLDDAADLQWLSQRTGSDAYVLQPFLSGSVIVVDIVRDPRSNQCAALCRKELIRTSNGAGITVRMMPSTELESRAARIASMLDLHGCANFEFLHTGTEFLLMDVNPRFSAGVGFSVRAGYDMVRNHLNVFLGESISAAPPYANEIMTRCASHLITLSAHE